MGMNRFGCCFFCCCFWSDSLSSLHPIKEVKSSSCLGRFPSLPHPSLFFTLVFLTFFSVTRSFRPGQALFSWRFSRVYGTCPSLLAVKGSFLFLFISFFPCLNKLCDFSQNSDHPGVCVCRCRSCPPGNNFGEVGISHNHVHGYAWHVFS